MSTNVYTETTCQGCGKVAKREGQWDGVPPVGWLSGDFQIADKPDADGGYHAKQEACVEGVCVACGDKVLAAVGVKRKRQRREQDPVRVDMKTLEDVDRWAHSVDAEHTHIPDADDLARRYDSPVAHEQLTEESTLDQVA